VPERVLIILDEAYYEYSRDNPRYPDSMHYRYDNAITLRTFSKIYGLAGLRVGYGFAHEDLITHLHKVKLTFEPNLLAEVAGIAALGDKEWLHRTLELNARGMEALGTNLPSLGLMPVESSANFVMIPLESPERARSIFEGLLARGVITRQLSSFGLPQCLRISTGTEEEMDILFEALAEVLR
jgi:histidinol-phosphate aminotransferase